MIDIYCDSGAFLGVDMRFDVLDKVMKDDFIKPEDFISVHFVNGDKGAIRKKSINGFCESREEL